MATRPTAARPMKALTPCEVAAALEVAAGAEAEALEEADEVGVVPALVPVLEAVLEALKVTPTARQASLPALRAVSRSSLVHDFLTHAVTPATKLASLQRQEMSVAPQLLLTFAEQSK